MPAGPSISRQPGAARRRARRPWCAGRPSRAPGPRARRASVAAGRARVGVLGSWPLRRRHVEVRRLGEDLRLERAQGGTGVDAQLVGEHLAGPAQRRQRRGLAVRPVEREGEEAPALLAERVLVDERLEVADDELGLTELEARGEEAFAGHRSELGEPGDLRLRPRLPRVVGVGGAAPQPERGLQGAHRLRGRQARRRLDRRLEGPRVHGVGREPQHVARTGAGDDALALPGRRVGLEPPAQVAHVGLQRPGRVGRRVVTPHAVDQSIGRHHLVPQDDQPGQYGALTPPAEVHDRAVSRGRELAEHVQVKLRLAVHPTSSRRLRRG